MAKSESWKRFCKDHFEVDPFKAVKILKGNRKNNTITCLQNMAGQLLTNERQILKTLAETFFPQLSLNFCHTSELIVNEAENIIRHLKSDNSQQAISNDEIKHAISSLKTNKAPGYDGITTEHILFFP